MNALFSVTVLVLSLLLHQANSGVISTVNDLKQSSSKTLQVHHAHSEDSETSKEHPRNRRSVSTSNSSSVPVPKVEVV